MPDLGWALIMAVIVAIIFALGFYVESLPLKPLRRFLDDMEKKKKDEE